MRDEQPNERTVKIELLSQWKLEAEFRNIPKLSASALSQAPHPSTLAPLDDVRGSQVIEICETVSSVSFRDDNKRMSQTDMRKAK